MHKIFESINEGVEQDSRNEILIKQNKIGGEGGIRTLDTLLTHTHFPGVRFQPLTHFTVF